MGPVCSKGDYFHYVFWNDPIRMAVIEDCCAVLQACPHIVMDVPELECIRRLLQTFGVPMENVPDVSPSTFPKENVPDMVPSKFPKIPRRRMDSELQDGVVDVEEEDFDDMREVNDGIHWTVDVEMFPAQAHYQPARPVSRQKQNDLMQHARTAVEAQHLATALTSCTETIALGSPTALLYAKRAEVLLKLKRPSACIKDCNAALALNPDAGKAFRLRGIAWAHLGNWSEARVDLLMGQQLDFDENIVALQKFVDERYQRILSREARQHLLADQRADCGARHTVASWIYESQNLGLLPANFNGEILLRAVHEAPDIERKLSEEHVLDALYNIMINPRAVIQYQHDQDIMKVVHPITQGLVLAH